MLLNAVADKILFKMLSIKESLVHDEQGFLMFETMPLELSSFVAISGEVNSAG